MTASGSTIENNTGLIRRSESSSLKECMTNCDTADATVKACNSIVIDRDSQISNRCQLHDVAVGENNITSESSGSLQYFNRPYWYRGMHVGTEIKFCILCIYLMMAY